MLAEKRSDMEAEVGWEKVLDKWGLLWFHVSL